MPASDQGADPANRYMLIPRTLIFLTRPDGEVLLLKGAPGKRLWANLYNGIGGHVERGEDVLSAARRELAEETGLASADLWLCGVVLVDTGQDPGIGIYVLRGTAGHGSLVSSPEGNLEWVPAGQIDRLPLVADLYVLLPRILDMRPGDPPFSALITYDESGQARITLAPAKVQDEDNR